MEINDKKKSNKDKEEDTDEDDISIESLAIAGATGTFSYLINGVYDVIDIENGNIKYVRRLDKRVTIEFYTDPVTSATSWKFIEHSNTKYKSMNFAYVYVATDKPIPLHKIKEIEFCIADSDSLYGTTHDYNVQPLIRIVTKQDKIATLYKEECDQKSKLSLHADFNLPSDIPFPSFETDPDVTEMQVRTMYKMVEHFVVNDGGGDVSKKLLYLTNQQSALINEDVMKKIVEALHLDSAKFVIILMPSMGIRAHVMKAHQELVGEPYSEFIGGPFLSSELNEHDEKVTETQTLEFMNNIILPLAIKTSALIIVNGANDCSLSYSLAKVACAEQARLGDKCPFTVVAVAYECEVHYKASFASEKSSLASQVCRSSAVWKSRIPIINKFCEHKMQNQEHCDLNPAASTYVIFESIDNEGHLDTRHMQRFKSLLIECMTKDLPSIAIQAYYVHDRNVEPLVELLKREVPVLLLDSTERSFTNFNIASSENIKTNLALASNAFPKITNSQKDKILNNISANGKLCENGRAELLSIAESMLKTKYEVLTANSVHSSFHASMYAFIHAVLTIGSESKDRKSVYTSLYESIAVLKEYEKNNSDSEQIPISADILKRAIIYILSNVGAQQDEAMLAVVDKWMKNHPNQEDLPLWEIAIAHRDTMLGICNANKAANGEKAYEAQEVLQLMTLLSHPLTFSGSIYSGAELKRKLNSIAKIDRLPSNSLESLISIQDAWDKIEIYDANSQYYKIIAKLCFILLLLMGIAVSAISVVGLQDQYNFDSTVPVLCLGFGTSAIIGYIAIVNPSVRWQHLRLAKLRMESNIWMFRTRCGPYRIERGNANGADITLATIMRGIKDEVMENADMKTTSFYSRSSSYNLHGQHEVVNKNRSLRTVIPASSAPLPKVHPIESFKKILDVEMSAIAIDEEECVELEEVLSAIRNSVDEMNDELLCDNHYDPLTPEAYIEFRVKSAIQFYQSRIPGYNRTFFAGRTMMLLGSIATAAVSFWNLAMWSGVISITTSSIAGYLEYHGTNEKISRYSFTVNELEKQIIWWNTLTPIDKASLFNIDNLVLTCEGLLQKENGAWKSSNQAAKQSSSDKNKKQL